VNIPKGKRLCGHSKSGSIKRGNDPRGVGSVSYEKIQSPSIAV